MRRCDESMHRRLAAIVSADVAGYSRLMAENEAETIRAIVPRREVFRRLTEEQSGRVVDTAGDSVLAEFPSVVAALEATAAIQREITALNDPLPPERRMAFRVGIHIGEIVVDDDRIYGDGVNIAARIQGLAEPGGIAISAGVYDQVRGKLALTFAAHGEHAVKNIAAPVRIYRVLQTATPAALPEGVSRAGIQRDFDLPEKPSIAVLPFTNMSGDADQEYFADGIAEDIITALSKIERLFVVARASTFTYKQRPAPVQQVSREQGVRYVLEGSVRKAGERVRITAQLVDGSTGRHLWAERYDRQLSDVFAVQDEITKRVVTELQVQLTDGEVARLWAGTTTNLEAYDHLLKGRRLFLTIVRENNLRARDHFREAIRLDPACSFAHAWLGWTYWWDYRMGWAPSRAESLVAAEQYAESSLALSDATTGAHTLRGAIHLARHQLDRAIEEGQRAVELAPNSAASYAVLAAILGFAGRPEDGRAALHKAMRLSPIPQPNMWTNLGHVCLLAERHEEALDACANAERLMPENVLPRTYRAIVQARLGRWEEARATVAALLVVDPAWSIERFSILYTSDAAILRRDLELLRRAGLPERR